MVVTGTVVVTGLVGGHRNGGRDRNRRGRRLGCGHRDGGHGDRGRRHGAAWTAVVWIAGLAPAEAHVRAPRPWTSHEIRIEGPDHESGRRTPVFSVVLMLISGRETAFDCTGPVKTTVRLLPSAAGVYVLVRSPPVKVTPSSDATWSGDGITRVIQLMTP